MNEDLINEKIALKKEFIQLLEKAVKLSGAKNAFEDAALSEDYMDSLLAINELYTLQKLPISQYTIRFNREVWERTQATIAAKHKGDGI